jgi:hypothetical protein
MKSEMNVEYTPDFQPSLPDKTSVYYALRNDKSFIKTVWQNGKASFKANRLGNFEILTDTIPPSASVVRKTPEQFILRISDKLSGIRKFKAYLNDEYILTDYDYKSALLWSVKNEVSQKFIGKLRLELEDNQGNRSAFETMIDSVSVNTKVAKTVKPNSKTKTHELKNRRKSPKFRAERPKRKHH